MREGGGKSMLMSVFALTCTDVLLRLFIERFFATGRAEVISLAFVLGLAGCGDFVAPALYFDRFRSAALDHLGGSPERHDAALFSRLTGATYATHLTLVKPGDVVVGISPSYSHPSVVRAATHAGAKFV